MDALAKARRSTSTATTRRSIQTRCSSSRAFAEPGAGCGVDASRAGAPAVPLGRRRLEGLGAEMVGMECWVLLMTARLGRRRREGVSSPLGDPAFDRVNRKSRASR